MHGVVLISIISEQSSRRGLAFAGFYALLILIPGIVLQIIPRWVEDGYVWAFWLTCAIAVFAMVAMMLDAILTCGASVAMMSVPLRVLASILNAWPDVQDMVKDRRRRNRPQGFQPIMALPSDATDVRIPVIPVTTATFTTQDALILPRFMPESLLKTARNIRALGGIMLFFFLLSVFLGLAINAEQIRQESNPLIMIATRAGCFLMPAIVFMSLSRWIDIGRQWAVVVVTATAGISILAAWATFALSIQSTAIDAGMGDFCLALISSIFCGLVLVFCMYVWRDILDVSRGMARNRLEAQRPIARPSTLPPTRSLPRPNLGLKQRRDK